MQLYTSCDIGIQHSASNTVCGIGLTAVSPSIIDELARTNDGPYRRRSRPSYRASGLSTLDMCISHKTPSLFVGLPTNNPDILFIIQQKTSPKLRCLCVTKVQRDYLYVRYEMRGARHTAGVQQHNSCGHHTPSN